MKKLSAVTAAVTFTFMLTASSVSAAYTQYDIQSAADKAMAWQEENANPKTYAGSGASDYYIMALSRMNKSYNFSAYSKLIGGITPSTKQDGQRLVMASAACGDSLSDSMVGYYTYQADLDSATDLAGAIITLDSGGYTVPEGQGDINNMVGVLLTMQQSDGSFGRDIATTAKAVIALSPRVNAQYQTKGSQDSEIHTYSVNDALGNALNYLSANQQGDGGFGTVTNTAYVITALDSIGEDADSNPGFVKNGASPIKYIISKQKESGSVNDSADDTAMAAVAMTSHLRAMQGKSPFFKFTSGDTVSVVADASSNENHSGNSTRKESDTTVSTDAKPGSKAATGQAGPTKAPEHSAVSEEEFGPFPFVGPEFKEQEKNTTSSVNDETDTDRKERPAMVVVVIIGILALAVAGGLVILKRKPELYEKIYNKLKAVIPESDNNEKNSPATVSNNADTPEDGEDKKENTPVVSTEELYNPDFFKSLIPVDEIDSSIDGIIENDETETENGEGDA